MVPNTVRQKYQPQASLTCLISLGCLATLHIIKPYRDPSDNTVAVMGQVAIFLWIYTLLLRVIGVVKGVSAVLCGVSLVIASTSVFVFAVHAIRTAWLKAESSSNDPPVNTTEDDLDTVLAAESSGGIWASGAESPQEVEIEMTEIDDQRDTEPSRALSLWAMLGICAAETEVPPQMALAGSANAEIKALQTKLREKDKAHELALRNLREEMDKAHDQAMRKAAQEKGELVAQLAASQKDHG